MARTEIVPQQPLVSGVQVTATAGTADGHKFRNNGRVYVRVTNNNAAARTVTFQTPYTVEGLAVSDRTNSITNGTSQIFGPFNPAYYNQQGDPDDGMVYVNFEAGFEAGFSVEYFQVI